MVKIPKIMAVDSKINALNLIKTVLESEGYEVAIACTGKECLIKLVKEKPKPDLILLEIAMPDLSGWEIYSKIRERSKRVKVAFLSDIEVSEERKEVLIKDGISDYITKPFTKDELVERIRNIIS